jgi:DNA-directed RNA polymerase specialized sigma24 family protein
VNTRRGKNLAERKDFLEACVKERGHRLLSLLENKIKGLDFALDYYGIGDRTIQSQGQIAKRFSVAKPFVSQEIAAILCFLGLQENWADTARLRATQLEHKIYPKPEVMSSRKKILLARQTESERLRLEMGWSDIPLDLSAEESETAVFLLQLYEEEKLQEIKTLTKNGESIFLALVLKYGLDAAGCYRETSAVAEAMNLSASAVNARLNKGRRIVRNKFNTPESAEVNSRYRMLRSLFGDGRLEAIKELRNGEQVYQAFILKYGLDNSGTKRDTAEVAKMMGITLSAFGSRMSAGWRYIRNALNQSTDV